MHRHHPLRYVLVAVAALLTACEPYDHHYAPAVAGQVMGGTTGRPVVGALVSLTAENRSVQTYTDEDGRFTLPRLHHWGTFPFADADSTGLGVLRIDAPGYQLYTETNIGGHILLLNTAKAINQGNYAHKSVDWEHIDVTLASDVRTRRDREQAPLPLDLPR